MKFLGIILIIVGTVMFLITGITYTTEETIIDAGPLKIITDKENDLNWPPYAGGIAIVAGFVLMAVGKKK
ncbi:hypothetical protein [Cyclobacterium marinum]|uniref:Uncharacterized protein n=1 Tax=Cyclobacterium marinum (strain ATCC 25205 / DSM 745 / LMG 13164 / NCIMB 1802) TaxID=880070 RepID=G0J7Z0_CYCMS|nr:hypothetical protein [Cyclobacterium marinum]AEL28659.1 hypothetical protein Cycma_4975 [Cyclobacterium marinum DSM 745]